MKSAGTEHSNNKYTLKKPLILLINLYVLFSLFYIDYSIVFLIVIQSVTSNYCFHKSYDFICI